MKRLYVKQSVWIVLCFVSISSIFGQTNTDFYKEKKYSKLEFKNSNVLEIPELDIEFISKVLDLTKKNITSINHEIDFSNDDIGYWKNKDRWHLEVTSKDAQGISILFDKIKIGIGAKLLLYDSSKSDSIVYTLKDVNNSKLITQRIQGEKVYIDLIDPNKNSFFVIEKVSHFLPKDLLARIMNCDVGINCISDLDIQCTKKSIAQMKIPYTIFGQAATLDCSGTLLNNTNQDCAPLFLTAAHCICETSIDFISNNNIDICENILDVGDYADIRFSWNYEVDACPTGTITQGQITEGATVLARGSLLSNDYALLLLDEDPKNEPQINPKPYYSGWDSRDQFLAGGYVISHPGGGPKEFASYNDIPSSNFSQNNIFPINFVEMNNFDPGRILGGSSGAGVYREATDNIIGVVSRADVNCNPNPFLIAAKFSKFYDDIDHLLNPCGLNIETLEGSADPCCMVQASDVCNTIDLEILDYEILPNCSFNTYDLIVYIDGPKGKWQLSYGNTTIPFSIDDTNYPSVAISINEDFPICGGPVTIDLFSLTSGNNCFDTAVVNPCGNYCSCNDMIQNGDETDEDCGGSCPSCVECDDADIEVLEALLTCRADGKYNVTVFMRGGSVYDVFDNDPTTCSNIVKSDGSISCNFPSVTAGGIGNSFTFRGICNPDPNYSITIQDRNSSNPVECQEVVDIEVLDSNCGISCISENCIDFTVECDGAGGYNAEIFFMGDSNISYTLTVSNPDGSLYQPLSLVPPLPLTTTISGIPIGQEIIVFVKETNLDICTGDVKSIKYFPEITTAVVPNCANDQYSVMVCADDSGALPEYSVDGSTTALLPSSCVTIGPFVSNSQATIDIQDPNDASCSLTEFTTFDCMNMNTCDDGIMNNGEQGIDCGGSCPPCVDCTPMFSSCPTTFGVSTDSGEEFATVTFAIPTIDAPCDLSASPTQTSGLPSGSEFPIGLNTTTYEYEGLVCTFNIIVNDNEPPMIDCSNNVDVFTQPGECVGVVPDVTGEASITDNDGVQTIFQSPGAGALFGGQNNFQITVTVFAMDNNNNSSECDITLTLIDNQPPSFVNCPTSPYTFAIDPDGCTAFGNWSIPVAEDNCDVVVTQTGGPVSGSALTLDMSPYTVEYTAADENNNTAVCTFEVIVEDTQILEFQNCPTSYIFGLDPDQCMALANWSIPLATDNCDVTVTQIAGPAPGTPLALGTYTITYQAVNNATPPDMVFCSFLVEVEDTQALEFQNCPTDLFFTTEVDECVAYPIWSQPIATDNCDVTVTQIAGPIASEALAPGTYTVTYEAVNNATPPDMITCSFDVTVEDNQEPNAICKDIEVELDATGTYIVPFSEVDGGSVDNCEIATITIDGGASVTFTCDDIGQNWVTLEVTDIYGNVASCDAEVTVLNNLTDYQLALDIPELCLEDLNNEQLTFSNYLTITDDFAVELDPENLMGTFNGTWEVIEIDGTATAGSIDPVTGIYTPGSGSGFVTIRYTLTQGMDACFMVVEDIFELRQPLDIGIPMCECDLPFPQESYRKVDLGTVTDGLEPYTIQFEGGGLDLDADGTPDVLFNNGTYVYDIPNGHNVDDFSEYLGELIVNPGETNWSFTIVDARGCEVARQGQCEALLDVPEWIGANSPTCFTDGTFDLSLNNSFDITADFLDGMTDNGDIIITKLPNALLDNDKCENHAGFNADTDFNNVFVRDAVEDRVTVNPENLIGQDYRYAGTYRITLLIPAEENTQCVQILVEDEFTIYPSFDACFDIPLESCGNAAPIRIDINEFNPGYDLLADDLLCRDLDEMSVWEIIVPNGTTVGVGTAGLLLQEGETDVQGNIVIDGLEDGDVIIDPASLYKVFGPGQYTLNHEMGIDICKTSCTVVFTVLDVLEVETSTTMPVVCCGDDINLIVDRLVGGTQVFEYQWSEATTGYLSSPVTYPTIPLFVDTLLPADTLVLPVMNLPGGCPVRDVYDFVLTVTDAKGCQVTDIVSVAINPDPSLEPEVVNAIYCQTNPYLGESPVKNVAFSTSVLTVDCSATCEGIAIIGDRDGDMIPDIADADLNGPDADGDGIPDSADVDLLCIDADGDGIPDIADMDVLATNMDMDGDGIPDAADADADGDGVIDNILDTDADGIPDAADVDADGDGLFEGILDGDADNIPDTYDTDANTMDADTDGICDAADIDQNPAAMDTDADGIIDAADVDLAMGTDTDGDGVIDAFDCDDDNDGIYDTGDADANGDGITDFNALDADVDGLLDGADPDIDNDGIANAADADTDGDNITDNGLDSDQDGINDAADIDADDDCVIDACDADLNGDGIDDNGIDTDGDGVNDDCDLDIDGDGIVNTCDADQNPDEPDTDGDNIIDSCDNDDDNDGIIDSCDAGGFDTDGDGILDAIDADIQGNDTDGDGITDAADSDVDGDGIPNTADADFTGSDNDSDGINDAGDVDDDNDGIFDAADQDPLFAYSHTDADLDEIKSAADVDATGGVDVDGDGIDDAFAAANLNDSNGDGIDDVVFTQEDNNLDGIIDGSANPNDSDDDDILDTCDVDMDNDGINDACDIDQNPGAGDADGDGIIDACDTLMYPEPTSRWYASDTSDEVLFDLDSDKDGINDTDLDNDPSTFDPVAAGLVDPNIPGDYTFYVECYCIPGMRCTSPRVPVTLTILDCQAPEGECTYLLVLRDWGGNGWEGASIDVVIDEVGPATNYKLTTEECDLKIIPITTVDGGQIDLTYWATSKENEHSWFVAGPDGEIAMDSNGDDVFYNAFPPSTEVNVKLDCPTNCEDTQDYYIVNTIGDAAAGQVWELRDAAGQIVAFNAVNDYDGLSKGTIVVDTVQLSTCADFSFIVFDATGNVWNNATWQIIGSDADRGSFISDGAFAGLYEIIGGPQGAFVSEQPCSFNIPCKPDDCPADEPLLTTNTTDCEFAGFVHPNPPTPFICYPNSNHNAPSPILTISYPDLGINRVDPNTSVDLPVGTNPVVFEYSYFDGQIVRCSSDVLVVTDNNPIFTCNDHLIVPLVGVTPNTLDDCFRVITPDELIENPLLCEAQYNVIIFDTDGARLSPPNVVGPDQVGLVLTYKVEHIGLGGVQCWGTLTVEDKIAPIIECTDYEVPCTHPSLMDEHFVRIESFAGLDLPANLGAEGSSVQSSIKIDCASTGEIIQNVALTIDHNHNRLADLTATLTSPSGKSVTSTVPMQAIDLEVFNGDSFDSAEGDWILIITDLSGVEADGDLGGLGSIFEVSLDISSGFLDPVLVIDCSDVSFSVISEVIEETNCDQGDWLGAKLLRTWQAIDASGNAANCVQEIGLRAPRLVDIDLPGDQNFECGEVPADPALLSTEIGGAPTFGCFPITDTQSGICDITVLFEDQVLNVCGNSYTIIRTWSVTNWCSNTTLSHEQLIHVEDTEGPVIEPANVQYAAGPDACATGAVFLSPAVNDICSDVASIIITYTIGGGAYDIEGALQIRDISNGESLSDLPLGMTEINIVATDICGNIREELIQVNTVDPVAPTAICNDGLNISLNGTGTAILLATDLDEGSIDNCGIGSILARRVSGCMDTTAWATTIPFECCDADEMIAVELLVTDLSGNTNTCWAEVLVEDPVGPQIACEPNTTVTCDEALHADDLFVTPSGSDNCDSTVEEGDIFTVDLPNCGQLLTKIFTVSDNSDKTDDATCIQTITVEHVSDFIVQFPADAEFDGCELGAIEEPIITDGECEMISISHEDRVFTQTADACYLIERTWTVINQCIIDNPAAGGFTDLGTPLPIPRTFRDDDGYFQYVQIITVNDEVAPTVAFTAPDPCDFTDGCEGALVLTATGEDDCSELADLTFSWKIDAGSTGTFGLEGSGADASGTYPYGDHIIKWTVTDGCGNATSMEYDFSVEDCKNPTPIADGLATVVMNDGNCVTITAAHLLKKAEDNCTVRTVEEWQANARVRAEGNNGALATQIEVCCTDVVNGGVNVEVWVEDEAGNQDFVIVFVDVQDNSGNCPAAGTGSSLLAGRLATEAGNNVEDATVSIDGNIVMTDASGIYSSVEIAGWMYNVTPEKLDGFADYLSTLDIVYMARHVLQINTLTTPYQLIAADVDADGDVDIFDLVELRQIVLFAITDGFTNNTAWRFVDASYIFQNPTAPWSEAYPQYIDAMLVNDLMNQDFVAVKIGDLDGSAGTPFHSVEYRSFPTTLTMHIDDVEMTIGNEYKVDFRASDFNDITGYQFTMNFDQNAADFISVEAGALNIDDSNFGFTMLDEGIITTSFTQMGKGISVNDDEVLFSINFTAKTNATLHNVLSLTNQYTLAEAYNTESEVSDVKIAFNNAGLITTKGGEFELYQNRPNPFNETTSIGFNLPVATTATLTITNMAGKRLKVIVLDASRGYNEVSINRDELGAAGLLYYQLDTDIDSASKKMIILD